MATLEDLLSQIPIGQIAAKLGVDEATAKSAVDAALPTLVGGLEANAKDAGGAASLQGALRTHESSGLLDGGVNIDDVDTADGDRIVHNVFGDNKSQVTQALGGLPGSADSALVAKVLPILAPIVMAYLAKRLTGGGSGGGGGALGDLLGGMLSGASGGSGSGGLGSILGGALGSGAGGGLGGLLGGLLGGGKK